MFGAKRFQLCVSVSRIIQRIIDSIQTFLVLKTDLKEWHDVDNFHLCAVAEKNARTKKGRKEKKKRQRNTKARKNEIKNKINKKEKIAKERKRQKECKKEK